MTDSDSISIDPTEDEVEQLVWALVDEIITAEQMQRLEVLLRGDDESRNCYLRCMQMHADLHMMFSGDRSNGMAAIVAQPVEQASEVLMPIVFDTLSGGIGGGVMDSYDPSSR